LSFLLELAVEGDALLKVIKMQDWTALSAAAPNVEVLRLSGRDIVSTFNTLVVACSHGHILFPQLHTLSCYFGEVTVSDEHATNIAEWISVFAQHRISHATRLRVFHLHLRCPVEIRECVLEELKRVQAELQPQIVDTLELYLALDSDDAKRYPLNYSSFIADWPPAEGNIEPLPKTSPNWDNHWGLANIRDISVVD
jgi:hypothetical protein